MRAPLKNSSKKEKSILLGSALNEQAAGLRDVAKLLGKTQSHVSKVEVGQRRIDIVALKELARIYKKTMDYFIK